MRVEKMSQMQLSHCTEYTPQHVVFEIRDPEIGLTAFVAVHKARYNVPGFGATRFWQYSSEEEALRDALRLSRLMSYKGAAADLPYTGAKAVIMYTEKAAEHRKEIFERYAKAVESLQGQFITGTDVGVTNEDVQDMSHHTSYVIGKNVDPAFFTARGVFLGIEITLQEVFGSREIRGRHFAVQGAGKTGMALLHMLKDADADLIITDTNPQRREELRNEFPLAAICEPQDIYEAKVDVFCPCALGGVLNHDTIPLLQCRAVAGSANNQLCDELSAQELNQRNILYAPDYVINLGRLASVLDEFQYHTADADRIEEKLHDMTALLEDIFTRRRDSHMPPSVVADEVMQERLYGSVFTPTYVLN